MEVALIKETSDVPWMDQLPNEILLMIFRNLNFKQLLQATAVCHRWNELAFFLLQDRTLFHLRAQMFQSTRQWTLNRIYRKVLSSVCYLHKDLADGQLRMAENVRELRCFFELAQDGCLLSYLRAFNAVESLELRVDRLEVSLSLNAFNGFSYGLLPTLRHLTLLCNSEIMVDLLTRVSSGLVSLKLDLLPRLVPKFIQCEIPLLESLTLRFETHLIGSVSANGLIKFLSTCQHLRKLALFVDEDYSAIGAAFANPTIEDLTLGGNFSWHPQTLFYGISQLTNLRSLRLILETECVLHLVNPLPTVETLIIKYGTIILADVLTTVFPNLKVLHRDKDCLVDHEVQLFVSTWRNTMEDLSTRINPTSEFITHFCGLKKLRKLTLELDDEDCVWEETIDALAVIASMNTLKELNIGGCLDVEVDTAVVKEKLKSRTCAIFNNGEPLEKALRG